MRAFRTVLEQQIKQRQQTLEEFVEYAETFARERNEPGTLSLRHLQRLVAGEGPKGQPLGSLRPATARLLEGIFGLSIEELLAQPTDSDSPAPAGKPVRRSSSDRGGFTAVAKPNQPHVVENAPVHAEYAAPDLALAFDWLDERAGWMSDTSRRRVMSRLAKLDTRQLVDRNAKRARVSRSQVERALAEYYGNGIGGETYRARCGDREVRTSVLTGPEWLDLNCPLTPANDQVKLAGTELRHDVSGQIDTKHAVNRFAEAAAQDVRVANAPLYRLLSFSPEAGAINGTVEQVPFAEYALTTDLLESELVDAIAAKGTHRPAGLPLRDKYLPDIDSVLDLSGRLCAGGALALCAVARPADPYRGPADYALLVQERSSYVLNGARRLSVIPKSFHQPLTDARADARIGATLRREMEEELFGRGEVDSTAPENRVAEPMHPKRLSEPMRWLSDDPHRLRMECTGFGLNLVSGNYEFAGLIVIDDDEFWTRYGGHLEANWEASGLRLYSSLDHELISELVSDESWTNEGLFALLQGIRRLQQLGDDRVNLPSIEATSAAAR